jgi:hypothetical protein
MRKIMVWTTLPRALPAREPPVQLRILVSLSTASMKPLRRPAARQLVETTSSFLVGSATVHRGPTESFVFESRLHLRRVGAAVHQRQPALAVSAAVRAVTIASGRGNCDRSLDGRRMPLVGVVGLLNH